jgi:ankyrin repeat protein
MHARFCILRLLLAFALAVLGAATFTAQDLDTAFSVGPLPEGEFLRRAELHLARGRSIDALDECGRSLLALAARDGHVRAVGWLLARQASVKGGGGLSPLHAAINGRHPSVVALLLEAGADPKEHEGPLGPALHAAALSGQAETVRRLIAAGASVHALAEGQTTALHAAARIGSLETVAALLAADANPLALDEFGRGPLHQAVRWAANPADTTEDRQRAEVVRRLLAAGESPMARELEQRTPLHFAAGNGFALCVDVLLAAGADARAVDAYGLTPEDHAQRGRHGGIVRTLRNRR